MKLKIFFLLINTCSFLLANNTIQKINIYYKNINNIDNNIAISEKSLYNQRLLILDGNLIKSTIEINGEQIELPPSFMIITKYLYNCITKKRDIPKNIKPIIIEDNCIIKINNLLFKIINIFSINNYIEKFLKYAEEKEVEVEVEKNFNKHREAIYNTEQSQNNYTELSPQFQNIINEQNKRLRNMSALKFLQLN